MAFNLSLLLIGCILLSVYRYIKDMNDLRDFLTKVAIVLFSRTFVLVSLFTLPIECSL